MIHIYIKTTRKKKQNTHIPYTMSWRCLLRGIIYTQNLYTTTKNAVDVNKITHTFTHTLVQRVSTMHGIDFRPWGRTTLAVVIYMCVCARDLDFTQKKHTHTHTYIVRRWTHIYIYKATKKPTQQIAQTNTTRSSTHHQLELFVCLVLSCLFILCVVARVFLFFFQNTDTIIPRLYSAANSDGSRGARTQPTHTWGTIDQNWTREITHVM